MKMGLKYNFSRGGLSSPRSVPLTCQEWFQNGVPNWQDFFMCCTQSTTKTLRFLWFTEFTWLLKQLCALTKPAAYHIECWTPPKDTCCFYNLMTWCTGKSDGSRGSTSKWRSFTNRTKPGLGKTNLNGGSVGFSQKTIYERQLRNITCPKLGTYCKIWWKTFAGNFLGFSNRFFRFPFWENLPSVFTGSLDAGESLVPDPQGIFSGRKNHKDQVILAALPSNGWSVLGRRDHLALGASAKQIDVIGYLRKKKMMRSNNCYTYPVHCVFTTRYVCVLWSSYVFRTLYIFM